MGIEEIDAVEAMRKEIQKAKVEIIKLKEETPCLTPIQQMVQLGKSKKLQIQLQKLHEEEMEFLKVTQPWQDEIADLV